MSIQPYSDSAGGGKSLPLCILDMTGMKTDAERLRFFLRYAILAPSNLNTQPWLFDLQDDHVDLVADRSRSVGAFDPFDRELIISCGAALGVLDAAARAYSCPLRIVRFPERSNPDLLARVFLEKTQDTPFDNDTIEAILNRRTNRNAFNPEIPITADERRKLDRTIAPRGISAAWIERIEDRARLAQMIMDADRIQYENPSFLRELASWIRVPNSSAGDGIAANSIGISGVASYVAPLVVRTFDVGNGKAARDQQLMSQSPSVVVFSTAFDAEKEWLACGEGLAAFLIVAERLGLQVSYLNQPCEVSEVRFRLSLLDPVRGNPQLVLRLGHTPIVPPPTHRRKLAEVLRDRRT